MRKLSAVLLLTQILLAASAFGARVPRRAEEFVFQSPDGKQTLLTSYKGKTIVLAFMFTTCPHCQHTAQQVLTKVQTEYKGKDVQVLGAVFDAGAPLRVQQFNTQLGLNFPCGFSTQENVLKFLQLPADDPFFVPILVFIDRNFNIRSQYIGDEKFLANQEVNIRAEIDKMLKPAAAKK
jgi:peroxiredoxin